MTAYERDRLHPADLDALAAAITERLASPPSRLLDADALAERWGVATKTIYALVRGGRLPAVRVGPRRVRFRLDHIEAWEAAGGDEAE